MKYVVITPVKNEEKYIKETLESMINQCLRPDEWIIVDDNSTDMTCEIISEYLVFHQWIKLYKKTTSDNNERSGGSKIVGIFNWGMCKLKSNEYNIIVKLDADLSLPANYFSAIIKKFNSNPKLALCGGYCLIPDSTGNWIREYNNPDHVRGAFKAYRKEAFMEIGGLKAIWNWDGIDEMMLRYKGYQIETVELPVKHFRPTSTAYNPYKHSYKSGQEVYRMRYGWLVMAGKALNLMKENPFVLKGACFIGGFLSSLIKRDKPILNSDLSKFIRQYYCNRIIGKKH